MTHSRDLTAVHWSDLLLPPINLYNMPVSKANEIQHGGNHYKQFKGFEPWDVITEWGLGYLDGTALKYIARWKHKNGLEDLRKAIHFLQKAIEVEEAREATRKAKEG